jgi:hypothetical protein
MKAFRMHHDCLPWHYLGCPALTPSNLNAMQGNPGAPAVSRTVMWSQLATKMEHLGAVMYTYSLWTRNDLLMKF